MPIVRSGIPGAGPRFRLAFFLCFVMLFAIFFIRVTPSLLQRLIFARLRSPLPPGEATDRSESPRLIPSSFSVNIDESTICRPPSAEISLPWRFFLKNK